LNDGAKIIRTGQLQLEVADVSRALLGARSAIQGLGGYIGASQQQQDGEDTVATITYRIPADKWESALDALRRLGKELSENTSSADVTGQIVDLDARIRNLKASETAPVGYISKATKVSDVPDIESRLWTSEARSSSSPRRRANLDDQVTYATLAVTFGVNAGHPGGGSDVDPAGEADRAGATLVGFVQGLVTAGIWFGIVAADPADARGHRQRRGRRRAAARAVPPVRRLAAGSAAAPCTGSLSLGLTASRRAEQRSQGVLGLRSGQVPRRPAAYRR
jgi:hypothetical protein